MDSADVDISRRKFLIKASSLLGGAGAACAAFPFLASWQPSARAVAGGAPVEVDISKLQVGQCITVEWRSKPVFILHRSQQMIDELANNNARLRDPFSKLSKQPEAANNLYRSINPKYLVLVGICTHLGCVPLSMPQPKEVSATWPGGFFCPCHGSWYDLAGRVFKSMPAPLNLVVPKYKYLSTSKILIGA